MSSHTTPRHARQQSQQQQQQCQQQFQRQNSPRVHTAQQECVAASSLDIVGVDVGCAQPSQDFSRGTGTKECQSRTRRPGHRTTLQTKGTRAGKECRDRTHPGMSISSSPSVSQRSPVTSTSSLSHAHTCNDSGEPQPASYRRRSTSQRTGSQSKSRRSSGSNNNNNNHHHATPATHPRTVGQGSADSSQHSTTTPSTNTHTTTTTSSTFRSPDTSLPTNPTPMLTPVTPTARRRGEDATRHATGSAGSSRESGATLRCPHLTLPREASPLYGRFRLLSPNSSSSEDVLATSNTAATMTTTTPHANSTSSPISGSLSAHPTSALNSPPTTAFSRFASVARSAAEVTAGRPLEGFPAESGKGSSNRPRGGRGNSVGERSSRTAPCTPVVAGTSPQNWCSTMSSSFSLSPIGFSRNLEEPGVWLGGSGDGNRVRRSQSAEAVQRASPRGQVTLLRGLMEGQQPEAPDGGVLSDREQLLADMGSPAGTKRKSVQSSFSGKRTSHSAHRHSGSREARPRPDTRLDARARERQNPSAYPSSGADLSVPCGCLHGIHRQPCRTLAGAAAGLAGMGGKGGSQQSNGPQDQFLPTPSSPYSSPIFPGLTRAHAATQDRDHGMRTIQLESRDMDRYDRSSQSAGGHIQVKAKPRGGGGRRIPSSLPLPPRSTVLAPRRMYDCTSPTSQRSLSSGGGGGGGVGVRTLGSGLSCSRHGGNSVGSSTNGGERGAERRGMGGSGGSSRNRASQGNRRQRSRSRGAAHRRSKPVGNRIFTPRGPPHPGPVISRSHSSSANSELYLSPRIGRPSATGLSFNRSKHSARMRASRTKTSPRQSVPSLSSKYGTSRSRRSRSPRDVGGYDEKADIWSLGIFCLELAYGYPPDYDLHITAVLYNLLRNDKPPGAHSYDKRRKQNVLTRSFQSFITRCLQKEPSKRASAKQLLKHRFLRKAKGAEFLKAALYDPLPKDFLGSAALELNIRNVENSRHTRHEGMSKSTSQVGYYSMTRVQLGSQHALEGFYHSQLDRASIQPSARLLSVQHAEMVREDSHSLLTTDREHGTLFSVPSMSLFDPPTPGSDRLKFPHAHAHPHTALYAVSQTGSGAASALSPPSPTAAGTLSVVRARNPRRPGPFSPPQGSRLGGQRSDRTFDRFDGGGQRSDRAFDRFEGSGERYRLVEGGGGVGAGASQSRERSPTSRRSSLRVAVWS